MMVYKYKDPINIGMIKRSDVWDAAIIIGALMILIWALLKSFNIINSPAWVDMVPYFGASFSIIGAAYKLGKIKKGIEETDKKVDRILSIEQRFLKVEHEHNLLMSGKLSTAHH